MVLIRGNSLIRSKSNLKSYDFKNTSYSLRCYNFIKQSIISNGLLNPFPDVHLPLFLPISLFLAVLINLDTASTLCLNSQGLFVDSTGSLSVMPYELRMVTLIQPL